MKKTIFICLFALVGVAQGMWAQTTVSNETQLNTAIANGGDIVLGDNITLSNRLEIDAEMTLSIDLNGYKLNRGNPTEADGYGHVLIIGGGANVTIKDSRTGGTITGGNADAGGGIWIGNRGTVTLQSGLITGCTASGNGGAIYNLGNLTINGGTIDDNTAGDGGGIYNDEGATLTFAGGSIENNTSTVHGGAGISNHGTLTVSGGTVSGNTSVGNGSGIWTGGENSTLNMQGNPVVTGNHKGSHVHNVYVSPGKVINVTGAFTAGANIGLTLVGSQTLTSGYGTHNGDTDPNTIFHLDSYLSNIGTISLAEGEISCEIEDYVTDVMLIGAGESINSLKNQYQNEGWTLIDYDLNKDVGGATVFLLYKTNSSTGSSGTPITDFYIKVGGSADHPETIEHNGRTYTLTPGGGNNDFNNGGRDLNRSAGGKFIYLYYTKQAFDDNRAVTALSVNSTRNGAVRANGGANAADLNSGAGGKYIFLHADYPQLNSIKYVERSWDENQKKLIETDKTLASNFTRLTNSHTTLTDGWYVVDSHVDFNKIVEIKGDVNILLVDGMTLNAPQAIRINTDYTLTVYAQREGTGRIQAYTEKGVGIGGRGDVLAGNFVVHGGIIDARAGSANNAGIGGGNGSGFQGITIYGGTVTGKANNKEGGAGIGCGKDTPSNKRGPITIYGGNVTALGGSNAAGIGGGYDCNSCTVYIYGGNITATGGEYGPGIGGGQYGRFTNDVYIYGGTITATGHVKAEGIGIGTGGRGDNNYEGILHIENATVTAEGSNTVNENELSYHRAINGKTVTIINSTVDASRFPCINTDESVTLGEGLMVYCNNKKVKYAEWRTKAFNIETIHVIIKPCDHEGATYQDNGDGTHTVSCTYCSGVTVPHDSYAAVGGYRCVKCEAEKPENVDLTDVALYIYKYNERESEWEWRATNYTVAKHGDFTLPSRDGIDGYDFVGWVVIPDTPSGNDIEPADDETIIPADRQLKIDAYTMLAARYRPNRFTLADDESNEAILTENLKQIRTVTLADRKLWKDDSWNTICLPFSLTAEELAASPLSGYTGLIELDVHGYYDAEGNHYIKNEQQTAYLNDKGQPYEGEAPLHQTGFDTDTGTLYLYFQNAPRLDAGKPYLIKWDTAEPNYFEAPQFSGVTISTIAPTTITSEDGLVTFIGTYEPVNIGKEGDNTLLYLGSGDNLYWPNAEMTIGCQRAYFQLNGITAGDLPQQARTIVLNFLDEPSGGAERGDDSGDATRLNDKGKMINDKDADTVWYDLSGRKLNGKPTKKGVYINNGKKQVIK